MKLRNKKTGVIVELDHFSMHYSYHYDYGENARGEQPCSTWNTSLAELNEEWEDYEEPKTFWYMTAWGDVKEYSQDQFAVKQKQAIGNYFETREEAEKAVKKLKAWKRLKDKGFRFTGCYMPKSVERLEISAACNGDYVDIMDDLDLFFGGEE